VTRDRAKRFVSELRKKNIANRKKEKTAARPAGVSESETPIEQEPLRLLSKETIRNIVAALRAAMSEAVETGRIVANPAVRLGKYYKQAADYREEIDPFTAEEVTTLLETTRDHCGFENYVLMLTLFHCGLRAGEAAGLHWSDLDTRNKT